ncbi:MAG: histidine phosphatase family protein [Atopobiaceae bacterium]|nr:histidine phosphatase family protein [Atopobiaceae bacterium]
MPAELYILRHGETLFNIQHKTQGWCDSPLTARGMEQARQAGRTLAARGIQFDAWYSSTSERCCDTLELACEAGWGVVPAYERDKGLKEFNFGAFEAKDQCLEHFPHGDFYVEFGGESEDAVLERFSATLLKIMARGHQRVLAVSHGGTGIMLFHSLVPHPEPGTVPFGNCICYRYAYEDGALRWLETIVPDFSALDDPSLPTQVTYR